MKRWTPGLALSSLVHGFFLGLGGSAVMHYNWEWRHDIGLTQVMCVAFIGVCIYHVVTRCHR